MHLLLDAGNTRIKLAHFQNGKLIQTMLFDALEPLQKKLANFSDQAAVLFSNVGGWPLPPLLNSFSSVVELSPSLPLPIKINYATPATLGNDRRALAVAAYYQFPKQNCLIIDAGTCVTYDLLTDDGVYEGGAISPGMKMRLKALHHFTDRLPSLDLPENISWEALVGNSTQTSIYSGALLGLAAELEGIINRYQQRYSNLKIVLTGGDAPMLLPLLKNDIFAAPNFLFYGLDHLLRYTLEQN